MNNLQELMNAIFWATQMGTLEQLQDALRAYEQAGYSVVIDLDAPKEDLQLEALRIWSRYSR